MSSAARLARRGTFKYHSAGGGGGTIALASSYVQNFTTATGSAVITGVTAASGTIAVLVINVSTGNSGIAPSSITDGSGNTWTKQQQSLGQSGQSTETQIWTAPITSGLSSGSVTITVTGGTRTLLASLMVFSNATLTGIVGANDNANNTAKGSVNLTVTSTGRAAIIGGATINNATAPSAGPGTGYTALGNTSSQASEYGVAAYQIVSGATTSGPSWTFTPSSYCGACTIGLASL